MRNNKFVIIQAFFSSLALCFGWSVNVAEGHNFFKDELQSMLSGTRIDCNACHIDKKPKTQRNPFGMLFHKEFAADELSKNWKAKKGQDKTDYRDQVMIPAFQKAAKKVLAMTVEDLAKSGALDGIKSTATTPVQDGNASKLDPPTGVTVATTNNLFPVMMLVSMSEPSNPSILDRIIAGLERKYLHRRRANENTEERQGTAEIPREQ